MRKEKLLGPLVVYIITQINSVEYSGKEESNR